MATKRRKGGGRKPVVLPNPFVTYDEWGDESNILWGTEDELDIRIEDIMVGCVRAFNADRKETKKQDFVDWYKLLRVYRNVWELKRDSIQDYLMCSERQANKYMQVIKLANPFLERYMQGKSGSNIRGYIDVTPDQVKAGYLTACLKSKEGHPTAVKETSKETNKQEKKEWLSQAITQLTSQAN